MKGIITPEKNILGEDGKTYTFDAIRGMDDEGYPEILIDAKEVGGRGWMARQSIKPFIGMNVEFQISFIGFGYNYQILKQKSMCLTVTSKLQTAKKDFYTLKLAESVTEKESLSYYQCVVQKYKEVLTAPMKEGYKIGDSAVLGLHSFYKLTSNNLGKFLGPLCFRSPFQDCRGVLLCRIPKGAKYYLGEYDIVSNKLEIIEPLVVTANFLPQTVDFKTNIEALNHALKVCLSYNLNMEPS